MLRRSRPLLGALAVLPLLLLGVHGTATAAGDTAGDGAGDGAVSVRVPVSDCAAPAPGQAQCYATHLVTRRVAARVATRFEPPSYRVGHGPAGGYTPAELARAYGQRAGAKSATSQVIAIVDAFHSPNALKNLNKFDARYHLPRETTNTFRVTGQTGGKLPKATNKGWAGETDLDLQAVRGMCHHCKILLVEANGQSFADFAAAENTAARRAWKRKGRSALPVKIISNSYGAPERSFYLSKYGSAYNHRGKAILVSSGDDGWFDWDYFNYRRKGSDVPGAASFPAVLNTVVGVGGTTLRVTKSGLRNTETTWNRNGDSDQGGLRAHQGLGAAGSGCSEIEPGRDFEVNAAGYAGIGCATGKRSVVDIAALADPYTGYDVYSAGRWATYGGTSLSSPLTAAMWALAGGPGSAAYPAQNLYSHLGSSSLYDVTVGGNGMCGLATTSTCSSTLLSDPASDLNAYLRAAVDCQYAWGTHAAGSGTHQCRATTGLDGVSGVGTPKGSGAFKPAPAPSRH